VLLQGHSATFWYSRFLFFWWEVLRGIAMPPGEKMFLPAGQHKTKKKWGYCKTGFSKALTFGLKKLRKSNNGGY
jgi:hypothetical protein